MTAHDIAIYKPCAVIDRAYKDSPKEFFMVEEHARTGGMARSAGVIVQGNLLVIEPPSLLARRGNPTMGV